MRQSLDCRVISMLWLEVNIEAIVALNNVVTRLAATAYQHVAVDANVHVSRRQSFASIRNATW
jgi:hypothetical protein